MASEGAKENTPTPVCSYCKKPASGKNTLCDEHEAEKKTVEDKAEAQAREQFSFMPPVFREMHIAFAKTIATAYLRNERKPTIVVSSAAAPGMSYASSGGVSILSFGNTGGFNVACREYHGDPSRLTGSGVVVADRIISTPSSSATAAAQVVVTDSDSDVEQQPQSSYGKADKAAKSPVRSVPYNKKKPAAVPYNNKKKKPGVTAEVTPAAGAGAFIGDNGGALRGGVAERYTADEKGNRAFTVGDTPCGTAISIGGTGGTSLVADKVTMLSTHTTERMAPVSHSTASQPAAQSDGAPVDQSSSAKPADEKK